jgi:hypothetical protein
MLPMITTTNDDEINSLSQLSTEELEGYDTFLDLHNNSNQKTYMSKLQTFLETANRMIDAGIDQIVVGEILIEQLQEEIKNLKVEAFDLLPVVKVEYIEEK